MAINFPTSLDALTNPNAGDYTTSPSHSLQHSNANDAIEALEAKVGIDGSAVTTSHDYKLSEVTGSDKAVGKTATQTLTNKTLTSPVINVTSDATGDIYYRSAGGLFTRLPIGSANDILIVSGGIPAWSSASSYATKAGVQDSTYVYAASNAGSDTYAITLSPAPSAYATGQRFMFKADVANTGAATLNVNSLGAKTIKKNVSDDLETGDILANQIVEVVYDGTNFQLKTSTQSTIETTIFNTSINTDETSAGWYTWQIPVLTYAEAGPDYQPTGWTENGFAEVTNGQGAGFQTISLSNNGGSISTVMPGTGSQQTMRFTDGKKWKMKFYAKVTNDTTVWGIGLLDNTTYSKIYTAETDTSASQMRLVFNSSSIYLANSNGTNYTNGTVSGITRTNWNLYTLYFDGTNLYVYVNGTLKATNSTNLPTATNATYLVIGGDAINQSMDISPITFSKEM